MLIEVLGTIPGHRRGQVVRVAADDAGTPLDRQWRRRLRDAERDGCCRVVDEEPARVAEPDPSPLAIEVEVEEGRPDNEPTPTRRRRRRRSEA